MTTAHPIFRFPVFLMGMLGGLQVLRAYQDRETSFHDPNLNKNLAHCILPWGWGSSCCKKKSVTKKGSSELTKESVAKIWKRRVDFNAFLYVGFLSALVVTKVTLDLVYGDKKSGIYMVYGPSPPFGAGHVKIILFYISSLDQNVYINAHRNENGSFIWPNGTVDSFEEFTYWDKGEPGNYGGEEDCTTDCRENCAAFYGEEYKWHDLPCSEELYFICQFT